MKIATIGYRSSTGLAYQVNSLVKHLPVTKVLVADLSGFNGMALNNDWYPDARVCKGMPKRDDINWLLHGIDLLLVAESPLNYEMFTLAKKAGVKTVCVENPEFYDFIVYPDFQMPDAIILPSVWKEAEIREHAESRGVKVFQLHHPVDREVFKFRARTSSKTLHIAGKPAAYDRNGTFDYLNAEPNGRVVTQNEEFARQLRARYRHSNIYTNVNDPVWMYQLGDVLVYPRKYGGNSLPLNEALSSGLPVIMTDIEPNNHLLPKEWLVPAKKTGEFTPRTKVDIYSADPDALKEKIEWFKTADMEEQSLKANDIAESISWERLKPRYMEVLENL